MNENNINTKRQEEIFRNIFIGNVIILILLVLLNIVEIEFIILRAVNIFSFWITLFIIIFIPRRLLKKSKRFRYIILYIRKNYPKIFSYYFHRWVIDTKMEAFFKITRFYLERFLKYFLIGTKTKKLKPYRENWEKGEFIMDIILEIYNITEYIIIYILKIFYEIIKFFDNATIYKIVRSRILGFMMVTIGYIIMGVNFFIIYILSWIIGFFLYTGIHIYVNYKRKKEKNYDRGELKRILILFGYYNYLVKLYDDTENIKKNGKIIYNVIKFKKDFYYNSVKRKYGTKVATECILTEAGLTTVRKDDYSLINRGKALNEGIEFIYLSRGKFFTDIHVKILWYEIHDIREQLLHESFYDSEKILKKMPNLLYMHLFFIGAILHSFIVEGTEINEINEKQCIEKFNKFWNQETKEGIYYLRYWKEFFEFKELYEFVKIVKQKKDELGYKGLKEKLQEIDFFAISGNIVISFELNIFTISEITFLKMELCIQVLEILNIKYDKKEYEEICFFLFKENSEVLNEKITKKFMLWNANNE